ncbi:ABC transporter permease [Microbacterium maritypicum]|nr:ABC transporter permease [Microbacterium liquefaciens]
MGLVIVILVLLIAAIGPFLAPYGVAQSDLTNRLAGPSAAHLLGTDELGQDLLSRVLVGTRVTVYVAGTSVLLASIIGVTVGAICGYFGGWFDGIVMRVVDVMFAFPAILLALLIVAVLGPGLNQLIIAITLVYIPAFARVSRGVALSVRRELYIEAAYAIGLPVWKTIVRYVIPNILSPVMVLFTVTLASGVLVEATLSFLGLGVQPPEPSWGNMLNAGKAFMELSPWGVLVPGGALVVTMLGLNLLGDSLRDILDPRL